MTCIVGLVQDGRVYMGGDSAGVSGLDMTVRADPKVFRNGHLIIGCTSSFRMRDLLQYGFVPPEQTEPDMTRWMVRDVIPAMRACFKDGGFASKDAEKESGGTLLVGCHGRLFFVDGDYQVGIPQDGFMAVGCGDQVAHGSLFSTAGLPPEERVLIALRAAERFSAGVRAPFVVLAGE